MWLTATTHASFAVFTFLIMVIGEGFFYVVYAFRDHCYYFFTLDIVLYRPLKYSCDGRSKKKNSNTTKEINTAFRSNSSKMYSSFKSTCTQSLFVF